MIIWTILFLIIAIISGYFAFKKKGKANQIAKIVFYVFLVLFVISLILWLIQMFFHPSVNVKPGMP